MRIAPPPFTHRRGTLTFDDGPAVMGIINATPDSFSDGGLYASSEEAVDAALRMVDDGASIIDVGGESTRPGAKPVRSKEELRRVMPVVWSLREQSDVLISIDTTKAEVAKHTIEAGADIVNDVSAGTFDDAMLGVCAELRAGLVLMHTPGRPTEMNDLASYEDVRADVAAWLAARCDAAIAAGVESQRIALDPGFGFGKTADQNYRLLAGLEALCRGDHPVLAGVSRKRMIRAAVGDVAHAVEHGTTAAGALAAAAGAAILRVHDVPAGVACARVAAAYRAQR